MRRHRQKLGGKGDTSKWANTLKKNPCFIIGNAPSLKKVDLNLLDDYFTIGINRIFKVMDPTIIIWQDLALWIQCKKKLKKIKAIKYCRKASASSDWCYYFRMEGTKSRLTGNPAQLYGRGSSGAIAFQLAYSLGCNPIVLVGMDCKYDKKGNTNFYGNNPMHRPHTLVFCKKALKWIRDTDHGKKIINCSKNSVFDHRLTLEEAIKEVGEPRIKGRKELVKKILNNNQ